MKAPVRKCHTFIVYQPQVLIVKALQELGAAHYAQYLPCTERKYSARNDNYQKPAAGATQAAKGYECRLKLTAKKKIFF